MTGPYREAAEPGRELWIGPYWLPMGVNGEYEATLQGQCWGDEGELWTLHFPSATAWTVEHATIGADVIVGRRIAATLLDGYSWQWSAPMPQATTRLTMLLRYWGDLEIQTELVPLGILVRKLVAEVAGPR